MIKDLVKLADNLDKSGFKKEADYIDSMIKKVAGDDPKLIDALRLACKKFVEKTPDPKNYKGNIVPLSGRSKKSNVELGEIFGNVAFYISGHREYPLLSQPEGDIVRSSFRSEDEIMKTLISSVGEAFSELGMNEQLKTIKLKALKKVTLYTGLSGFRVETNIPFRMKPYSVWSFDSYSPPISKERMESSSNVIHNGETGAK